MVGEDSDEEVVVVSNDSSEKTPSNDVSDKTLENVQQEDFSKHDFTRMIGGLSKENAAFIVTLMENKNLLISENEFIGSSMCRICGIRHPRTSPSISGWVIWKDMFKQSFFKRSGRHLLLPELSKIWGTTSREYKDFFFNKSLERRRINTERFKKWSENNPLQFSTCTKAKDVKTQKAKERKEQRKRIKMEQETTTDVFDIRNEILGIKQAMTVMQTSLLALHTDFRNSQGNGNAVDESVKTNDTSNKNGSGPKDREHLETLNEIFSKLSNPDLPILLGHRKNGAAKKWVCGEKTIKAKLYGDDFYEWLKCKGVSPLEINGRTIFFMYKK
ncbi:MAG: hypothetical protein ACTSUE_15185 [Promethearchaeota archaeon]